MPSPTPRRTLGSRWLLVVLLGLLGALAGQLVVSGLTPRYEASAEVLVSSPPASVDGSARAVTARTVESYGRLLSQPYLLDRAARALDESSLPADSVRSGVVGDSDVLRVTVRDDSLDVARERAGGDQARVEKATTRMGVMAEGLRRDPELAKALADFLFDDERAIVRIDMSEYSEKHAVSRLVGAPPGYVGYDEGGQLTEAVRRRPYSVVLLDEVEKAHPEVFDILLQVLDDGRLTDGQGRTVDFRNVILILTSNLGSVFLADPSLDEQAKKDAVMDVVKASFKPEFLNRLDEIVTFEPLGTAELTHIVDLQLASLGRRLAARRITLDVTDAAKEWLALTGWDPAYGARPLRRLVQQAIGDRLAKALLAGEVRDGDTVRVDREVGPDGVPTDSLTVTAA